LSRNPHSAAIQIEGSSRRKLEVESNGCEAVVVLTGRAGGCKDVMHMKLCLEFALMEKRIASGYRVLSLLGVYTMHTAKTVVTIFVQPINNRNPSTPVHGLVQSGRWAIGAADTARKGLLLKC
jgi:hypothetical protein